MVFALAVIDQERDLGIAVDSSLKWQMAKKEAN